MRFTYNQLKKYIKTDLTPKELETALTMLGLEIEDMEDKKTPLADFIVDLLKLPLGGANKFILIPTQDLTN